MNIILSVISCALIIFIILMLIPTPWSSRTTDAIIAIATAITAFGVYMASQDYFERKITDSIELDEAAFIEIQKRFMENPDLDNFYKEIYGKNINPKEHALVSIMIQRMEDVNDIYNYNNMETLPNDEYIKLFKIWVNAPTFKKYYPTIQMYFDSNIHELVSKLQNPNLKLANTSNNVKNISSIPDLNVFRKIK